METTVYEPGEEKKRLEDQNKLKVKYFDTELNFDTFGSKSHFLIDRSTQCLFVVVIYVLLSSHHFKMVFPGESCEHYK